MDGWGGFSQPLGKWVEAGGMPFKSYPGNNPWVSKKKTVIWREKPSLVIACQLQLNTWV